MNKIKEIHSDVLLSLNKHNNTWLPLALKLNELVAAVGGKSKKDFWQKHFTVDSFYQYCKIELKDDSSTMYKYPLCAEQIEKHRPDLIKLYESDNSIKIAGFTVFYELVSKKQLTENVVKEIVDNIIDDDYSRSQVASKVHKHLSIKSINHKPKSMIDEIPLSSFEIIEGRESLYAVRIPNIKNEVMKYYDGIDDEDLFEVEEALETVKSLLQKLSFKYEEVKNAA